MLEAVSSSARFEHRDAEKLSEKIRVVFNKLRKMTEPKEFLSMQRDGLNRFVFSFYDNYTLNERRI